MVIIIFILCIIGCFYGFDHYDETTGVFITIVSTFIGVIALFSLMILTSFLGEENAINKKIQSYEQENFIIESGISVISSFPELKTNELMWKNIEDYIENKNIIKELKEKKAKVSAYKWWVYFGR